VRYRETVRYKETVIQRDISDQTQRETDVVRYRANQHDLTLQCICNVMRMFQHRKRHIAVTQWHILQSDMSAHNYARTS